MTNPTIQPCAKCGERGKDWNGSDPICAFTESHSKENWNCETLNKIRDICYEGQKLPDYVDYQYCEDEKYATINISGIELDKSPLALWVSWYKNRGRTDALWLLYADHPPKTPSEKECIKIIEAMDIKERLK